MDRSKLELQVKEVMADILDIDLDSINRSTVKDHVASWDSINHVKLVVALEEEFQVSFEVTDIESMLSFSDIVDKLQDKLRP